MQRGGEPEIVGGRINEYVSDPVITFDDDQPPRSLDLPVAEPPPTPWTSNPAKMADVGDFGAVGDGDMDDSEAIQAACDSGAEIIYFPSAEYRIDQTIHVPASVLRLACMFTTFNTGMDGDALFRVSADCDDHLVVEETQNVAADDDAGTVYLVDHHKPRTLVLNMTWNSQASTYRPHQTAANGDVFFSAVQGFGKTEESTLRSQRVWARWINTENPGVTNFRVGEGATLWVLGYKCEREKINFDVFDGGTLEVLGGLNNHQQGWTRIYRITDGNVSVVSTTRQLLLNGDPPMPDDVVIEDTQGGSTKIVNYVDLPERGGSRHQFAVPLYVSYDPRLRGRPHRGS